MFIVNAVLAILSTIIITVLGHLIYTYLIRPKPQLSVRFKKGNVNKIYIDKSIRNELIVYERHCINNKIKIVPSVLTMYLTNIGEVTLANLKLDIQITVWPCKKLNTLKVNGTKLLMKKRIERLNANDKIKLPLLSAGYFRKVKIECVIQACRTDLPMFNRLSMNFSKTFSFSYN